MNTDKLKIMKVIVLIIMLIIITPLSLGYVMCRSLFFNLNENIYNPLFWISIICFIAIIIFVLYLAYLFYKSNKFERQKLNSIIMMYCEDNNLPKCWRSWRLEDVTAREKTIIENTNVFKMNKVKFMTYTTELITINDENLMFYIKINEDKYIVIGDNSNEAFNNKYVDIKIKSGYEGKIKVNNPTLVTNFN